MILKADQIAELLAQGSAASGSADPLVITPEPDLPSLRTSGSASVDLRLGTWFLTMRLAPPVRNAPHDAGFDRPRAVL